jgi:hypothetical protein
VAVHRHIARLERDSLFAKELLRSDTPGSGGGGVDGYGGGLGHSVAPMLKGREHIGGAFDRRVYIGIGVRE